MSEGIIAKQRGSAPKGTGKNTRKSKIDGFGKNCASLIADEKTDYDINPENLALLVLLSKGEKFQKFVKIKKTTKQGNISMKTYFDLDAINDALKPTLDARLVEIEANKKVAKKTMAEKTADKIADAVAVEKKKMELALKDAEDEKMMEMAEVMVDDFELDEETTRAKLEKKYGEAYLSSEAVEEYLVERFSEE